MEINWIFHTYSCNSIRDIVESPKKTGFPTTICGSTMGAASGKVVKTK